MAQIVASGKTKLYLRRPDGIGRGVSQDDTTAGDGKRHEIIPGKGALSTRMSGSIMQLLMHCGFRVAYVRDDPDDPRAFYTLLCEPYPFEVVGRIRADGSILKRQPELLVRQQLNPPVSEVYLKTSGRIWTSVFDGQTFALDCDDPLALIGDEETKLFRPKDPIDTREPIATIKNVHILRPRDRDVIRAKLPEKTLEILRVLRRACEMVDIELDDFKLEFGRIGTSSPYLIDVIDFDSWRAWHKGGRIDKQGFRDGETVEQTLEKFRLATQLVEIFRDKDFQRRVHARA